jgi:hypothetical protein
MGEEEEEEAKVPVMSYLRQGWIGGSVGFKDSPGCMRPTAIFPSQTLKTLSF